MSDGPEMIVTVISGILFVMFMGMVLTVLSAL